MAKVLRILKTLRNNWKKSTFAFLAISYGVSYAKDRHDTFELMRAYCEEAAKFGEVPLPVGVKPRHITVILNPAANRRKSVDMFDKYCAPIFHLAGISVSIVKTEYAGQTKGFMDVISDTQAVVLAGGDGTLSEGITGMLRREDADSTAEKLPIGILPLGRTNSVAKALFSSDKDFNSREALMKASMAVVKEVFKPVDVMKINVMEEEGDIVGKPVFSPGRVDWGAFHDAYARRDKYWLWGTLRSYASYVFSSYKDITWECEGEVRYVLPCSGCSKCFGVPRGTTESPPPKDSKLRDIRWWQSFIPKKPKAVSGGPAVDYSAVNNPECGKWYSKSCSTVDFSVLTRNVGHDVTNSAPHLKVLMGPKSIGMVDFVSEGWKRENDKESMAEDIFYASELEIKPSLKHKEPEQWIYIDKENFDVRPIHIALIPNKVKMFCPS
ncbi:acylglycerol kinase, mitochondrial [Ischnura elegans]|uniref:acylglycerol kinase, mitochondrial n=1 Tax=Ischnura elegans TaxID=197161 RepID=UPI001ED86C9E|nr:acylglycerol kinase, mitochondrial [Ischnura elegans]